MQLLAFERYRDLVQLLKQGYEEEEGLVEAQRLNVELRAAAMAAAAASITNGAAAGTSAAAAAAPAGKARACVITITTSESMPCGDHCCCVQSLLSSFWRPNLMVSANYFKMRSIESRNPSLSSSRL